MKFSFDHNNLFSGAIEMKDLIEDYFKYYLRTTLDYSRDEIEGMNYDEISKKFAMHLTENLQNETRIDLERLGYEGKFSLDGKITFREGLVGWVNLYEQVYGSLLAL